MPRHQIGGLLGRQHLRGDHPDTRSTLYRRPEVHLSAGRWGQSASHSERALISLRDLGGQWRTANSLTLLGRTLAGMRQPVRAHACWNDALHIYMSLGSSEGPHDVRQRLDGESLSPVIA